jgi:RNA polymerase sigma factor (sigma-70 family)
MPKQASGWSDTQLLEEFHRTGDRSLLGALLERYTLLLYGVGLKYLKDEEGARDAVQQVFLKAITELEKYRVEYPKSWIYAIMRNHCLMQLRSRGVATVGLEESMSPAEGLEEGAAEKVSQETRYLQLEKALEMLSREQRTCITMFYMERKSYQEVCQATGFDFGEVKSHIQNGRRNLRIILQRKSREA